MDLLSDKLPTVLADSETFRPWPEAMAQFEFPDPSQFSGVHKSAFADPVKREYPLTNAGLTFFGALHYRGRGGSDPVMLERFSKAASVHGVEEELKHYEPFFQTAKQASAPEAPKAGRFALTVKQANSDEPINVYPLECAEDVGIAAAKIASDYEQGRLPVALFGRAAVEVVKAAAAWSVTNLPERILEGGVDRLADPKHAELHIPAEATGEILDGYKKLAYAAEHAQGREREELADAWSHLDRALGRTPGVNDASPFGILWGGAPRELVVKAAHEFALFDKLGEAVLVPRAALASVDMDRARQVLRAEDAASMGEVVKAAGDLSTHPNYILSVLDETRQRRLLTTVLELTS